jgi:hypothetical protein
MPTLRFQGHHQTEGGASNGHDRGTFPWFSGTLPGRLWARARAARTRGATAMRAWRWRPRPGAATPEGAVSPAGGFAQKRRFAQKGGKLPKKS